MIYAFEILWCRCIMAPQFHQTVYVNTYNATLDVDLSGINSTVSIYSNWNNWNYVRNWCVRKRMYICFIIYSNFI